MRRPFASALIALGLVLATAVAGSARGGRPVIISTDLATGLQNGWRAGVNDIADGLAVGMALADGALDVRGVVVTFGNNDVEPEALVAGITRIPTTRAPATGPSRRRASTRRPRSSGLLSRDDVHVVCERRGEAGLLAGDLRIRAVVRSADVGG
jgi:hypothetical protein